MNRITRMLTMTGIGLVAGVTVGAGPAMAATGTASAPARSAASPSAAQPGELQRTVDVYSSWQGCAYAGQLGVALGQWSNYGCVRTFNGFALVVSFDTWGNYNSWDYDDWNGPWGISGGHHNFRHHGGGGFHQRHNYRHNNDWDNDWDDD